MKNQACIQEKKSAERLAQVPQKAVGPAVSFAGKTGQPKLVRLDSLLQEHERPVARKIAIAVEVDGAVIYGTASCLFPQTAKVLRDATTGSLVRLPAVMGG
jgi:hypothetical protein